MSKLEPQNEWTDVRQLERTDFATPEIFNNQALGLLNRIEYLKDRSVFVESFGAIGDGELHKVSEWISSRQYESLKHIQKDYPHVTSLDDSIDWAAFQKMFNTAITCYANDGLFVLNKPLKVGKQLRKFTGSGFGSWDAVFHNRIKTWEGTNLIFTSLPKINEIKGITSQKLNGGSRPDSNDNTKIYNLTSFMDANGSNRAKKFSAAITFELGEDDGITSQILDGFRIVPSIGPDHVSLYNNITDESLGADIDVGILRLNTEYQQIRNFQVVGYWRIAGIADIQTAQNSFGRGERCTLENGQIQGFCGLLERSSDIHMITAYSSNSFTIPYFDEWYFNSTGSAQLGTLSGYYNWNGINVDQANGTITFTGVTPLIDTDITGFQLRSLFRGTGKAGSRYSNLLVYGLNHKSGKTSKELGFSDFSRAHEVSGWPMRGAEYYAFKCQMSNAEPLNSFYGNMIDAQFFGCQHEVGRVIATPHISLQTWSPYPCFDTRAIRLYSWIASDKTMFTPRTCFDDQELFQMSDLSGIWRMKLPSDRAAQVIKDQNQTFTYYNGAAKMGGWTKGGNLEVNNNILLSGRLDLLGDVGITRIDGTDTLKSYKTSGTFAPARGDNSQSLGSSSERWSATYANRFMYSGTVGLSFGVGSPEGFITAAVGSIYVRTDPGASSFLYIKQSGTGNTGWIAK